MRVGVMVAGLLKKLLQTKQNVDSLSEEEKIKAEKASVLTARYLWNFLSGMTSKHNLRIAA